jgi:acyl-coenzyme A synthetase/AMP-(fatty) acid ligase
MADAESAIEQQHQITEYFAASWQSRFGTALTNRLLEHCRQNLPAEMVPREIVLVDALPA